MDANKKKIEELIEKDWTYLNNIKSQERTESQCDIAIKQCYEAIKYVPNRYKKKYSKYVIEKDWHLYRYCELCNFSIEEWIEIFKNIEKQSPNANGKERISIEKIIERIPEDYDDNELNSIIEKYFETEIISKKYQDKIFIIEKRVLGIKRKLRYTFLEFDDFYKYLDGNLDDADIYEYDFKDVDLKKYELKNVNINSSILIKNGEYDDTFYNNCIRPLINGKYNLMEVEYNNLDPMLHENNILPYQFGDYIKRCSIYYISDLHIDLKIMKKFPEHATRLEVEYYINKLVERMLDSVEHEFVGKFILIAGDVSASIEITKMFFTKLIEKKRIQSEHIIYTLGNHELFALDLNTENNLNKKVEIYRKICSQLGITFLQNDLLFITDELKILNEEELCSISDMKLKEELVESSLIIFGGIGFSGYKEDDKSNKLLMQFFKDFQLSDKFNLIYQKLKKNLYNKRLIILTHFPKQFWSSDIYNPNWIYVNGHTHINKYEKNQYVQLYADNQLGYYNENIILKRIDFQLKCNIFDNYNDGIYEITRKDYLKFYIKMGYTMICKVEGKYFLLKKEKIYMFIYQNEKGNLYILNGGQRNRLNKNNINYYYNNMNIYSNLLKKSTKSYYDYLNQVSEYIKSIGGSGNIHGAIIDIDYYNHLYVNIYDGKVTPYRASSMDFKFVYPTLMELLSAHCPEMLENLTKNKSELMIKSNDLIPTGGEFDEDTRIYKESRLIKKIQYLIDDNIIRIWNDNLLDDDEINQLTESCKKLQ